MKIEKLDEAYKRLISIINKGLSKIKIERDQKRYLLNKEEIDNEGRDWIETELEIFRKDWEKHKDWIKDTKNIEDEMIDVWYKEVWEAYLKYINSSMFIDLNWYNHDANPEKDIQIIDKNTIRNNGGEKIKTELDKKNKKISELEEENKKLKTIIIKKDNIISKIREVL